MRSEIHKGRIDWALAGAVLGLVTIGTISILSAASPLPNASSIVQRHVMALLVGVLAFSFGAGFNYQIFQDQSKTLYALTLAMMVAVLIVGVNIRGHKAWIRLPYFTFQPSELARICTVLVLANYLDRNSTRIESPNAVLGAFGVMLPVIALIILEPDFSSTAAFFPVLIAMLFCAGASLAHLAIVVGFGGTAAVSLLLWTLLAVRPGLAGGSRILGFFYAVSRSSMKLALIVAGVFVLAYLLYRLFIMLRMQMPLGVFMAGAIVVSAGFVSASAVNRRIKDYQRNRFLAFLAPETDPQEAAYNVNQALVAIGSGGVVGKGVFAGTQSRLGFLPERHTDFIYSVIGEEMGFVGTGLVLGLYLIMLWRIFAAGRIARDRYGYLVCVGIASTFGFYAFVNIGMNLGLVPVAGIPLPLISYGGSSLVVSLWALGVVLNIYSKRYAFF
ncbi:MAG: rod shape-determining protein RodA [Elusimicrobia bacterium]|nr:rod shape-determining protein RodA [Elusimicrobiota bacterium]